MKVQIALNITVEVPEQSPEYVKELAALNIQAVMQNDGEGLTDGMHAAEVIDYDFNVEVES